MTLIRFVRSAGKSVGSVLISGKVFLRQLIRMCRPGEETTFLLSAVALRTSKSPACAAPGMQPWLLWHRNPPLVGYGARRAWRYLPLGPSRKRKRTSGIFSSALLSVIALSSSAFVPYQFEIASTYHSGDLENVPYLDFPCLE